MTLLADPAARAPRTSVTSALARKQAGERTPLPPEFGDLACTSTPHPLQPLDMSQCARCFGWRDDPRHT
ncbi:hypothetical protein AB0N38_14100 [Micromonospora aurantiaca]|uniref:hypothetical protein n=1 Tax=Micromonospora aurantiaca (nom. illeg.) TaxID=47850 RepID=UPI00342EE558